MCQIEGSREDAMFMETSANCYFIMIQVKTLEFFVNSKRGTGNHCFLDLIISEQFSHRNLGIYTECDQLYCHKTFLNFS